MTGLAWYSVTYVDAAAAAADDDDNDDDDDDDDNAGDGSNGCACQSQSSSVSRSLSTTVGITADTGLRVVNSIISLSSSCCHGDDDVTSSIVTSLPPVLDQFAVEIQNSSVKEKLLCFCNNTKSDLKIDWYNYGCVKVRGYYINHPAQ